MTERKLASIQKIADIRPIPDADVIEVATVLGWNVVVKKNEFKIGDLVVYLEIDSWVPTELAPFLSKGAVPREYNGVKGERLRTVKLRGQVSQGLILPVDYVNGTPFITGRFLEDGIGTMVAVQEEQDVTEDLGIQKWEAPISAPQLAGKARGTFPTNLISKTDQERIQNCFVDIERKVGRNLTKKVWNPETKEVEIHDVILPDDFVEPTFEVTLKLDGSSMTLFRWEGELRVCSRNLELKVDEENSGNSFVQMAMKLGDMIDDGLAFQGELMGPGIQGNRENFKEHEFFVFDIFDIKAHEYFTPKGRRYLCEKIGLKHVPILEEKANAPRSVETALEFAEGPSINHKIREGLVWKCNEDPSFSFKTISNNFLLKGGN